MRKYKANIANKVIYYVAFLVAMGALIVAAVELSARAHADPELTYYAKRWADSGGAVKVCDVFDTYGMTKSTLYSTVSAVQQTANVTNYDAAGIVVYAVEYYCPRYWATLGRIIDGDTRNYAI